jgi:hypothetical protein
MTMEVNSVQGSKYANIFYDTITKVVFAVYLSTRDQALKTTEELIRMVREHPDFQDHDHQLFSELHLDQAGEFGGDPDFVAMLKRNNCKMVPNDQIDKRDNAAAEYIIGVIQRRLRTLMIDVNLPPTYWQYAMTNLIDLMNVVPRHDDIISKNEDSQRPMEMLSLGRIDRTKCNKTVRWYLNAEDWDTGDHLAGQVTGGEEAVEWWEHHDDDKVSVGCVIDAGRSHDSF